MALHTFFIVLAAHDTIATPSSSTELRHFRFPPPSALKSRFESRILLGEFTKKPPVKLICLPDRMKLDEFPHRLRFDGFWFIVSQSRALFNVAHAIFSQILCFSRSEASVLTFKYTFLVNFSRKMWKFYNFAGVEQLKKSQQFKNYVAIRCAIFVAGVANADVTFQCRK